MKRRKFITSSATVAGGLALFPNLISCKQRKEIVRTVFENISVSAGTIDKVRGNVSRFANRGGSVGLLETAEGFVVVDAQFPPTIQPLVDAISGMEGKPIQFLCNTHHHGDHTAGNIAFKDNVNKIVAHNQVPIYQKERAIEGKSEDKQLYATELFDTEYKIEIGSDVIKAYHFGAGHTYGDAIYHFENDNVVHMGDLIFNEVIPVYRVKDGSDAKQWVNILDTIHSKFDDDTKFIFGHSHEAALTIGGKDEINSMKNFLEASVELMNDVTASGMSLEEFQEKHTFVPGHESQKGLWAAHWNDFSTNLYNSFVK